MNAYFVFNNTFEETHNHKKVLTRHTNFKFVYTCLFGQYKSIIRGCSPIYFLNQPELLKLYSVRVIQWPPLYDILRSLLESLSPSEIIHHIQIMHTKINKNLKINSEGIPTL